MAKTIDGICKRLFEFFGPDYKIYVDCVKQNFTKPCFVVKSVNSQMIRQQKYRWLYKNDFQIIYYSGFSDDGESSNFYEIQTKLYTALSEIEVCGSLILAKNMSCKLSDGNIGSITVLQDGTADGKMEFYLSFDMFLIEMPEPEPMEKIERIFEFHNY